MDGWQIFAACSLGLIVVSWIAGGISCLLKRRARQARDKEYYYQGNLAIKAYRTVIDDISHDIMAPTAHVMSLNLNGEGGASGDNWPAHFAEKWVWSRGETAVTVSFDSFLGVFTISPAPMTSAGKWELLLTFQRRLHERVQEVVRAPIPGGVGGGTAS